MIIVGGIIALIAFILPAFDKEPQGYSLTSLGLLEVALFIVAATLIIAGSIQWLIGVLS